MFTSGFTMNPFAVAETMQGETMQVLKTLAIAKKMCHYRKYRNYRKQQLLQPIGFCFSNRRNQILRQKTFVPDGR